jgi:hypothetical protein
VPKTELNVNQLAQNQKLMEERFAQMEEREALMVQKMEKMFQKMEQMEEREACMVKKMTKMEDEMKMKITIVFFCFPKNHLIGGVS